MPHPESKMRASVLAALRKNGFHAEAVDNESCSPGTPDITYCGRYLRFRESLAETIKLEGWLELKQLSTWPKFDSTTVRIPHLTEKQRFWLRRRWQGGGATSVLLRVGSSRKPDWMLFDGDWAGVWLGKVSHGQLVHAAVDYLFASPLSGAWLSTALAKVHERL